ncbi:T9SS type A sorting domain-containing protein [Saccharicrinis sp. FJH62]|uniref:T9SS type A sorting domain-containing protein n=1 Tax=Saccharicrinis sp. FJH62 TaxID=3344657 RepID=UPI0035D472EC
MIKKHKKLILSVVFVLTALVAFGQRSLELSVISSFGENSESTSYNISQTMGELMTETFEGQSGSYFLTQGFHQETTVITSINPEESDIGLVYPNPTRDRVYVDLNKTSKKIVKLDLYDITGKMIKTELADLRFNEGISLSECENGIYLLRISDVNGKLIQTCKIEKIQ